jgi:hypothetical protein
VLALVVVLLAGASRASAGVRSEADWILTTQLPDGAIATSVDRTTISPYLGNYAALGLARAAELTGESRYARAAWGWLNWYAQHQDVNGFVTDYKIAGGRETTTGGMDSTDAYAGTFLVALEGAWQATSDRRALRALTPAIAAGVGAIEATQDTDGLTWAKPRFRVKYLMDQAETYAGLRAATTLALASGDFVLSLRAMLDAAWMSGGVARLWNPRVGAYDWAVQESGARKTTDWSLLYPDAVEQTWLVAFGLVTGARAGELMRRFARAQSSWDRPEALGRFDSGSRQVVGYWPNVASAFGAIGDSRRSDAAAAKIEDAAVRLHRAWPFTSASAGQLIVLAGGKPAPWEGPKREFADDVAGTLVRTVVGVVALLGR